MGHRFAAAGAILAALAVVAGAFGAHALRTQIEPNLLVAWESGARYQMYHALGLLFVAWASERWNGALVRAAGWLFIVGTVLFSGSLYALALSAPRMLGAVTPVGGLCFIIGWVCLALATRKAA